MPTFISLWVMRSMALKMLTKESVKFLVVHCSATQAKANIGAKEITQWHRQRGFLTIGYHFVIRRDGTVEKGRPITQPGAHEPRVNAKSIGVCMVGGLDDKLKPQDNFTDDQYAALAELLLKLKEDYPEAEVLGHRDIPGVKKDCPCFDVRKWWDNTVAAPKF